MFIPEFWVGFITCILAEAVLIVILAIAVSRNTTVNKTVNTIVNKTEEEDNE